MGDTLKRISDALYGEQESSRIVQQPETNHSQYAEQEPAPDQRVAEHEDSRQPESDILAART